MSRSSSPDEYGDIDPYIHDSQSQTVREPWPGSSGQPAVSGRGRARGRATPPIPQPRKKPVEETDPSDPLQLIPGPDETTLLPRIPKRTEKPSEPEEISQLRRKRGIRRHRDDTPVGGKKASSVVRVCSEMLATIGVLVLAFSAYVIWGNNADINTAQAETEDALISSWDSGDETKDPTLDPVPGNALARLYMPQIRPEPWTIVEGTKLSDIETAPGHYEDNAMPGDIGNFAMAGHNVPAIFRHIDVLESGDEIVVETMTKFYIYEIQKHEIVQPTDVDVVAPVPNEPGVEAGEDDRWLTMTTCHPWWDNYERYVVWGKLVDSVKRGDELPPEAKG